jgi:hypothetical protein
MDCWLQKGSLFLSVAAQYSERSENVPHVIVALGT